jgi:flavin reductase (DIM6/NTAB) family NADH-FMN oxidoreductase RutF
VNSAEGGREDPLGDEVNMKKQHWRAGNMLYPLPAVMVSCAREGEKPNIITAAWVGTICSDPAMVSVSIRPERYSYQIIRETGEFVINLTTKELAYATDYCGVRSGRDVDKFLETGLTAEKAQHLKYAPVIGESPVNIECRVTEVKELGSHHMFLAEVLGVSVDEAYLNEKGRFELNRTGLIAYSHGAYLTLGDSCGSFGYSVRKKRPGNAEAPRSTEKESRKRNEKERSFDRDARRGQEHNRRHSGKGAGKGLHRRGSGNPKGRRTSSQ